MKLVNLKFLVTAILLVLNQASAQTVRGDFKANGQSAKLTHAAAFEVDSKSEPGYLDTLLVLSDRPVNRELAMSTEKLEEMVKSSGLTGLVVLIDPDAKILRAEPLHPSFRAFISSGTFVQWKPSTYDESKIAGRIFTDGEKEMIGQKWSYDLTFSAPISLDPEAKTVN